MDNVGFNDFISGQEPQQAAPQPTSPRNTRGSKKRAYTTAELAEQKEGSRKKAQVKKVAKDALTEAEINKTMINGIPLGEYCSNVRSEFPENWILDAKARQTTSFRDAIIELGRHISTNVKNVDREKLFPRQERINTLIAEKQDPGSTKPLPGMNVPSWKHNTKKAFQCSAEPILVGSSPDPRHHFLWKKPNALYKPFDAGELAAIEKFWGKQSRPDQGLLLPECVPVERFYEIFINNHVTDNNVHRGRDKTYNRIKCSAATNYNKEIVAALIRACPTCKQRDNKVARGKTVAGTAIKRAAKRQQQEQQQQQQQQQQPGQVPQYFQEPPAFGQQFLGYNQQGPAPQFIQEQPAFQQPFPGQYQREARPQFLQEQPVNQGQFLMNQQQAMPQFPQESPVNDFGGYQQAQCAQQQQHMEPMQPAAQMYNTPSHIDPALEEAQWAIIMNTVFQEPPAGAAAPPPPPQQMPAEPEPAPDAGIFFTDMLDGEWNYDSEMDDFMLPCEH